MYLDIKKTVIKVQLRRFFTAIIFMGLFLLFMIVRVFKDEFLSFTRKEWALIIAVIYIVISIIDSIRRPYYIFFEDDKDKIVIKFFSLGFFNRKKNMIAISKNNFAGYKVKKSLFGLKEKLILYQKVKNKTATYQPVSIVLLSKKEKKELIDTLNTIPVK